MRVRSDFEALWRHPSRAEALARLDLLEDVVRHKSRFFASAWTHYDIAGARDVQTRAARRTPCCVGEGLCDDGAAGSLAPSGVIPSNRTSKKNHNKINGINLW